MTTQPFTVLILCTGNSARSILAESLVNHLGRGRFVGYSAGSSPKGAVHPLAIELLAEMKLPAAGFRSKSWDEFALPHGPPIDCVITVCDNAAGEVCPLWPGQPLQAHWGIADPAAVTGPVSGQRRAFHAAYRELEARIRRFIALPVDSLDRERLQAALREIGDG
jgi:arsenate reductase